MIFKSSAVTHIGKVRELNEDSYAQRSDIGVWVIADGMGGHAAGEVASKAVADAIKGLQPCHDFATLHEAVKVSLRNINHLLREQSADYVAKRVPGSTVVVLIIAGSQGAVVWVGDSRAYRYRDRRLLQLTRDHSYVQSLVNQGLINAEEAESHKMSNIITRAIGIAEPVELDSEIIEVQPGDQFLLCSDGLNRIVPNAAIESAMGNKNGDELIQSLLQKALTEGAPDNVTIICVQNCTD